MIESIVNGVKRAMAFAGLVAAAMTAGATDYAWVGTADGNWEDAANWDQASGYPSAAGDVAVVPNPASGSVTVTVNTPFKIATLKVGDTEATGNAGTVTVCFKTGLETNEVSGSVTVATGGVLTHYGPNDTITQRLALKVGGNLKVDTGGTIDVVCKGYADHKGPGCKRCYPLYASTTDLYLGSESGNGRCYGSIREPLDYGSATWDGGTTTFTPGGGSVYLDVAGTLTVNGTITASAANGDSSQWVGAPGSLYFRCSSLLGSGSVDARPGRGANTSYSGTSGGRIAIYQTDATALSFTGSLRTGRSEVVKGSCGTIYLEYSGDTAGEGTLIIDDDGSRHSYTTDLDPNVTDSSEPFGKIVVRNGGNLRIVNGATLKVTKGISVDSTSRLVAATGHVIDLVGDEDCEITGGSYMTIESLICTNAGKKVTFGTANADRITIAKGKTIRFCGEAGDPVELASSTFGTRCQFAIDPNAAEATFDYVSVTDVNASYGASILAIDSTNGGNNLYVGFSDPIAPGAAIAWTGASDTAWHNPANWNLGREPVASDAISIPSVSSAKYPTLGSGTYSFNRIAVASGASLTFNTTVLTVTNKLTVAGSLVFSGTESLTLTGDLDFTGGAVTAASSQIYIAGTGDQTCDFGNTTLNGITVSKTSGNISLGTHGFTADAFACSVAQALTLTFAAGETYTVPALSLGGTANRYLALVSSAPGTKWKLVTSSDRQGVSGVDATDSDASDGATVMAGRQSAQSNCANWNTTTEVAAWNGGSGNFTDATKWSTGTVPGSETIVQIAAGVSETLTVTLPSGNATTIAALTVKGATGGQATLLCNSGLTVKGDADLQENGVLTLNTYDDDGEAPNEIQGNLRIRSGALLTHTGPASTENAKVHLKVGGNVTIDAGGAIDVDAHGYNKGTGPGGTTTMCVGAAHAGYGDGNGKLPYGSILHPVTWGSSTCNGTAGGAIHLVVTGNLVVNGEISADGLYSTNDAYSPAGGSIWLECAALSGEGYIYAREGNRTSWVWDACTTASGGRIAIYQRTAKDFSAFPKSRIITNRQPNNAAGTVYLESADTSGGTDLYLVGNSHSKTLPKTVFPMPDDGSDYASYSNMNIHVGAHAALRIGDLSLTGAHDYSVRSLTVADGGLAELTAGSNLRVRRGLNIGSGSTLTFNGSNVLDFFGDGVAEVYGFTRTSGLAALVCTNAGKTVAFGTSSADQIAITGENKLTLKGTAENPVTLLPADGTGTWQINASGSAVTDIRYIAVSNSNASVGAALTAINSTDLGGNTSWSFSSEILPGDPIVWTGASSTDWSTAANWDRNRTPIATDYITIPALSGDSPNYPTLGTGVLSYDRITVAAGAALTVAGTTLTITDQLNVHGTLAFTGDVNVYFKNAADFTGATVTSENTLFHLCGDGDQTLDFGDATLDRVVVEKISGNIAFGNHGFSAKSFRAFAGQAMTLSFAPGKTYAFDSFYANGAAYPDDPLQLVSSSEGSAWNLAVTNGHYAVGGIYLKDCTATGGKFYAGIRAENGGNNTNVDFAKDVAGWAAGASGDYATAANWTSGAVPGADSIVNLAAGDGETITITAAAGTTNALNALNLVGAGSGKVTLLAKSPLVVRDSVEVRSGATLTLDAFDDDGDAPNVITNDLYVFAGGMITHSKGYDKENAKVHLEVRGSVTIDAGGSVSATGCGYGQKKGPGHGEGNCVGAAFTSWAYANDRNPYGSIFRPVSWGSAIDRSRNAGGAIHLVVRGALVIDGTVEADGANKAVDNDVYTQCGGSVWIECPALTGSGMVSARESVYCGRNLLDTKGSGGRIAIYQSVATDFSAFPKSRILATRNSYNQPGTVYLESADKAAGGDLYVMGISNNDLKTPFPMPDDGDDYEATSNVNIHVGAATVFSIGGMTGAHEYSIRSIEVANGGKAEVVAGATLRTRCGVSIAQNSTLTFNGSNILDLYGDDDAELVGFSRASGLASLVCTNAGKVVSVGTNAIDKVTLDGTAKLTLRGTAEGPITLLPLGGYGTWTLDADTATEVTLRSLAVSNSIASTAALTAINSEDLGGNVNWAFSEEILPGTVITWVGGMSAEWGLAANWDRNRTPVATDYVVIPSLSGDTPNYPTVGAGSLTYDRLTVNSGAALTVNGTTLTVTGQFNVHGTLVCANAPTMVLAGTADFADASISPESSVIRIAGTDAQTLDFGDTTLNAIVIDKNAGDITFGPHGFKAAAFHAFGSTARTITFAAGQTYEIGILAMNNTAYPTREYALVSSTPGTRWNLKVTAHRYGLGGVRLTDCCAVGEKLCAGVRCANGGNNSNVDFTEDVALWLGGESEDFHTAENWASGQVPDEDTDVVILPGPGQTLAAQVVAGKALVPVKSLALVSCGGGTASLIMKSPLDVNGACDVGAGCTLTLDCYDDDGDAPNAIGGDLNVLSGGTITHTGPASSENAKLHLKVAGNMTVSEGAKVTATGKGYDKAPNGPGASPAEHCKGGAYAGFGSNNSKTPYGSVLKPVNWGATINRTIGTGGAIHLDVTGTLTVDGTIAADGEDVPSDQVYAAGGGSVWIECAALVGGGTITARESNRNYTSWEHQTTGSGGRIAVYQRTATNFAAFPKSRMLTQRSVGTPCGTVFLASAYRNDGTYLYIDGSAKANMETLLPMPADGNPLKVYSDVNVILGENARVAICAYDESTSTKSATNVKFRDLVLTSSSTYLNLYGSTVEVKSFKHVNGRKWYKNYTASQTAKLLNLGGTAEAPGAIVWKGGIGLFLRVR